MKVAINKCYGGFSLSKEAYIYYKKLKGDEKIDPNKTGLSRLLERHDPDLIKVVEELGEKANGRHAKIEIIEIPDGIEYEIEEYDGVEWVAEEHRTWG